MLALEHALESRTKRKRGRKGQDARCENERVDVAIFGRFFFSAASSASSVGAMGRKHPFTPLSSTSHLAKPSFLRAEL